MRAAVIPRSGGADVLEIQDRLTPRPIDKQILVKVYSSALNRADLHQREGRYPAPPGVPADIPGLEFAGEVAGLGAGVSRWREGDRVFGIVAGAANAEYLVVDGDCVSPVPAHLSWSEAGAIPEAFITAYDAMITQARLQRDDNVLIHAIGSGVGLAGAQLARAWRASPYGTARTADKIERAREYGLVDGIAIADDPKAFVEATKRWTSEKGIDVTLDLVGGAYAGPNVEASAPHGRIMCIGTVAGRNAEINLGMVLGKRLTIRGTVMRARSLEEKRAVAAAFTRDVVPLFDSGVLRPNVDSVFPLDDIRAAHERLESNKTFGKVVVEIA